MITFYTYDETTKQLIPAKRILVRDGKTMILGNPADFARYLGAYPEGTSVQPACDEGYHAVPDGYALTDGKWVRKWRVEELPPPPPRVFSKLKITAALMKIETWLPVRDYLVQSGMYDLYLAAQDFKEDDEFFVKGLTELKAKFGMSDEEVEAILKEGVA
jgi:hypothetical protein